MFRSERQYVSQVILFLYCSFTVFVLGYLVWNSFRTKKDILTNTIGWPKEWSLQAYIDIFKEDHFQFNIFSSVIILVGSIVLIILLSSMVAYGLGIYKFRFRQGIMLYFLLGLMFPMQLGIVPIFLMIKNMGLMNSVWGVMLVMAAGISTPVLMLTHFFAKLPRALYESAKIDGAGEWKTFWRIMFPLASPIIVSLCIVISVGIWNNFFVPLVLLQNDNVKTIPLAIMKYTSNLMMNMDSALASSVLATIPILIAFFFLSDRIIEGVATGGVKE